MQLSFFLTNRTPDTARPTCRPRDKLNVFSNYSFQNLLRGIIVYKACSWTWLSNFTPKIITVTKLLHIERPVFWLIKSTIFKQFCGGETVKEVENVAKELSLRNVGIILDYAAEPDISPSQNSMLQSLGTEESYHDSFKDNTLLSIGAASSFENSIVSLKLTGLFRNEVLENLSSLIESGTLPIKCSNSRLQAAYDLGLARLEFICEDARSRKVALVVDAEQSFLQNAIDYITKQAMQRFNRTDQSQQPLILNTYQLYRKDGLARLKRDLNESQKVKYHFGAKLVRGAYVLGERIWAREKGGECPIFDTIEETHEQYDKSIQFVFDYSLQLEKSDERKFKYLFATHNFSSIQKAISLYVSHPEIRRHSYMSFAQLYGMSDNISFSLALSGYHVYKYVPFGPVRDVIPYLIRRAQENSSVFQMISSDAKLMWAELYARMRGKSQP